MTEDARKKIEAYLRALQGRLRGMDDAEVREIVEELHSHIVDKATTGNVVTSAGVEAALAALGSPEDLAAEYMTNEVLARAEVSRSPLRILDSVFRWATLSVAGFWVLLGTVTGYFLGFAFLLCAVLKPFHVPTAGLWVYPSGGGERDFSLRLGFGSPPAGGHEVLGWWVVPLGLGIGCALILLTTRLALGCARAYRLSHPLHGK
jgi:hypothetical protein